MIIWGGGLHELRTCECPLRWSQTDRPKQHMKKIQKQNAKTYINKIKTNTRQPTSKVVKMIYKKTRRIEQQQQHKTTSFGRDEQTTRTT